MGEKGGGEAGLGLRRSLSLIFLYFLSFFNFLCLLFFQITGASGGLRGRACRKALVACVQATALYGAELWWDDRKGAGVKNRCDELQKLEN